MFPITFISRADQERAADRLGVDVAVVKAVTAVEARGSGFIRNTDLPLILFEGHHFHKLTRGKFDNHHPHLSYPKWTKAHYKGGRGEYDRLIEALSLVPDDPEPALKSTSWGMFQIMGFNHEAAGHPTAAAMVNAFSTGEGPQLDGFVSFVLSNPTMAASLRERDWAEFARRYNGPGFKKNDYDTKLVSEFARARARLEEEAAGGTLPMERGDAAALQAALNVAIDAGLVTDGWMGNKTRAALIQFQEREGLPETGELDRETAARLGLATA
jgi:hypothetical protein